MAGLIEECRICGDKDFEPVLDLGHMPIVDNFLSKSELNRPEKLYPLKTVICKNCGLVQLNYVIPKNKLYHSNYAYDMSVTDKGVEHFRRMSEEIVSRFENHRRVLDIGSNTGALLEGFKSEKCDVLGVEPSGNVCEIANNRGIPTENTFFSSQLAEDLLERKKCRDIITATNVFAHIDDLHDTLEGVKTLLSDKGVFIIEVPYLGDLIKKNEFDTIYHEHLSYFSIKPLKQLFKQFDLEIFDIEKQDIHGGTIRLYVCQKNRYKISESVKEFENYEKKTGIHSQTVLNDFRYRVEENRRKLVRMVNKIVSSGETVVGVGGPAKGVTLLNYCNFDDNTVPYVTEKSERKIGKYIPGTHNKVVSDDHLIDDNPEYALLLPWNFSESIIANLERYLETGGKFIIPVPEPHIVDSSNFSELKG